MNTTLANAAGLPPQAAVSVPMSAPPGIPENAEGETASVTGTSFYPSVVPAAQMPPGAGAASALPTQPPATSLPAAPTMSPAAAFPAPTEAELRPLSTTLANAVGLPPQAAAHAPVSVPSSESSFYFFDVAQPTLPGGVPAAQSAPGTAMAPAPPAVPPVEAASLPAAPVVPPATALSAPPEAELRPLPTTLAGAAGLPAQAVVNTPASLPYGSSFYFLDAAQPAASPSVPAFDPEPYEFHSGMMPDLGFTRMQFDPRMIRRDFPILQEQVHGRPLIWLDSAATTQKPNAVIDRLAYFYRHENSNVHRASHTLAARLTDAYEGAREKVRRFLNASSPHEIVFVRGTTEGINLVAQSWGRRYVEKDDEVVITWLEHHANIVPWQMLCAEKGARLRVAPVDDRGQVRLEEYEKLLGPRTRLVAFSQVFERPRHHLAGARDGRDGPSLWRPRAGRWRAGGRAYASGRAGS